ncbi:DUF7079 family protein [Tautonia rosea]|uniref:DUF7079 family protein n=1 Tax=Tautonia rosea TaxID=2728037 RepID=UPI001472C5F4|nr:hypothetical protein [Tautonia rosea]
MRAASVELERRRPVWDALSDLFLDRELQPDDHRRIADVLASSGYSEAELEEILCREVGPVLWPNLLSVAGVWTGFDRDWLEGEILRAENRPWFRGPPRAVTMTLVRHDWEQIRAQLNPGRAASQ